MHRAHAVQCGTDARGWIPAGYCAWPDLSPEEGARCVVLLKHPGGEWRGPRLADFIDGRFETGDEPDGWQVYAWRPANASDAARLPPLRKPVEAPGRFGSRR